MRTANILALVAVLGVFMASTATASITVVFSDDFESYVSNLPPGPPDGMGGYLRLTVPHDADGVAPYDLRYSSYFDGSDDLCAPAGAQAYRLAAAGEPYMPNDPLWIAPNMWHGIPQPQNWELTDSVTAITHPDPSFVGYEDTAANPCLAPTIQVDPYIAQDVPGDPDPLRQPKAHSGTKAIWRARASARNNYVNPKKSDGSNIPFDGAYIDWWLYDNSTNTSSTGNSDFLMEMRSYARGYGVPSNTVASTGSAQPGNELALHALGAYNFDSGLTNSDYTTRIALGTGGNNPPDRRNSRNYSLFNEVKRHRGWHHLAELWTRDGGGNPVYAAFVDGRRHDFDPSTPGQQDALVSTTIPNLANVRLRTITGGTVFDFYVDDVQVGYVDGSDLPPAASEPARLHVALNDPLNSGSPRENFLFHLLIKDDSGNVVFEQDMLLASNSDDTVHDFLLNSASGLNNGTHYNACITRSANVTPCIKLSINYGSPAADPVTGVAKYASQNNFLTKSFDFTAPADLSIDLLGGDTDADESIGDSDIINLILDFGQFTMCNPLLADNVTPNPQYNPNYGLNGLTDVAVDANNVVDDNDLIMLIIDFGATGDTCP